MVGMFTLYNQPPCALIMFLTLLFTAGYWVVLTKAFNRPQRVMSMKAAAEMDRKNGVLEISSETLQRVYQPVVMRDNGVPSAPSFFLVIGFMPFTRLANRSDTGWLGSQYVRIYWYYCVCL